MSELGDTFRAMKDESKERRRSHRDNALILLKQAGILFEEKNGGAHLIVKGNDAYIDFWPGTGRWIPRDTKKKGFGVRNLIKYING